MDTLRTPDVAFAGIDDFAHEPRYTDIPDGEGGGLRVAHVEVGQGRPVLLMHGEPTWSYLYRAVIPALAGAGCRVLAPDLVGFGRSDKPTRQEDYSYARHVAWMQAWLDATGVGDVVFFGQDWGGLVGLRLVAADPDRFAAVVVGNTGLPTGDQSMPPAFLAWREFSRSAPAFEIGRIVGNGTVDGLAEAELAAYDAPFPDDSYKAGARAFPSLVPASPDDPAAEDQRIAWTSLAGFDKPFVTAFSDSDPITAGADAAFRKLVPGTEGMPHRTIEGAGHFIQEDAPDEVAAAILDTISLL